MIAAAGIWCGSYIGALSKRLEALERAVRFASFVADQIEYYETPFPGIALGFASVEHLLEDADPDGKEIADPVMHVGALIASGMDAGDAARFLSFFEGIGAGNADTEIRLCGEARRYFEQRVSELKAEYAQKKRSRVALALFAAFTLCVLVL